MRIATFALLSVALLGCAGTNRRVATAATPGQAPAACLHGENEAPEQRARRIQALSLTRHVNTLQAAVAPKSQGRYQPLSNLGVSQPTPDGFRLQITTDGASYAFSVKDTLDRCMFAYFSDQTGIILVGRVIQ